MTHYSIDDYHLALNAFDKAVCEACAVSNSIGNQTVSPYKGYSTSIFTRMCIHSQALISALPKSRWAKRDYECWDLSIIAPHVRALMEGFLLFSYISETPSNEDEWFVKLNVMNLNDCTRRIRVHNNIHNEGDEKGFIKSKQEIKGRLLGSDYFKALTIQTQKHILSGKALMVPSRDELLEKLDLPVGEFNAFYDVVSNYTHILPISFYRMEPNGRGSGVRNSSDLSYIIQSLNVCLTMLIPATDRLEELFPDTKKFRKGKKSKFTIGPKDNMKKHR